MVALLARPVSAEPAPSPDDAALLASQVHDAYCADAGSADRERSAEALANVAPAYGTLSAAWKASGDDHLLYWRGLLAECLSREAEAEEDLEAFLLSTGDDAAYAAPAKDARRRLTRLKRLRGAADVPPWAPGVALLGAGAGVGIGGVALHAGAWRAADYDPRDDSHGVSAEAYADLLVANRAGLAIALVGAGVGTAGLLVAALRSGSSRSTPGVAVVPMPGGGVVAAVGGRW